MVILASPVRTPFIKPAPYFADCMLGFAAVPITAKKATSLTSVSLTERTQAAMKRIIEKDIERKALEKQLENDGFQTISNDAWSLMIGWIKVWKQMGSKTVEVSKNAILMAGKSINSSLPFYSSGGEIEASSMNATRRTGTSDLNISLPVNAHRGDIEESSRRGVLFSRPLRTNATFNP